MKKPKRKTKKPKINRAEKYWICGACAKAKKWISPKWAVTGIYGVCGWCDSVKEECLIPTCDYSTPDRKAIWD